MSYFLLISFGFIASLFTAWKISKEKLYSERIIFDTVIQVSLFSLIGSRVLYVLFHFEQFGFNILQWLVIGLYPGLSIGGALLGASVALWMISDKKIVVPFPELVDVLTRTFALVVFPIFIILLFISPETGKNWGLTLPGFNTTITTHPIVWYRLISLCTTALIIALIHRKRTLAAGTYSAVFWLVFIVNYFIIDVFKQSDVYFWKFSLDQWIYAVLLLIIIIVLTFQLKQHSFFKPKK